MTTLIEFNSFNVHIYIINDSGKAYYHSEGMWIYSSYNISREHSADILEELKKRGKKVVDFI